MEAKKSHILGSSQNFKIFITALSSIFDPPPAAITASLTTVPRSNDTSFLAIQCEIDSAMHGMVCPLSVSILPYQRISHFGYRFSASLCSYSSYSSYCLYSLLQGCFDSLQLLVHQSLTLQRQFCMNFVFATFFVVFCTLSTVDRRILYFVNR